MESPVRAFFELSARTICRGCLHLGLLPVVDLGVMPLTAAFPSVDDTSKAERRFPLQVAFCEACSLVQLLQEVPADAMFNAGYSYFSSFSPALLTHARDVAVEMIDARRLGGDSLVVELASNDGYLLRNYVERGIPVLGIDPSQGPAESARRIGVPTLCEFFGTDLGRRLVAEGKTADVIHANNVLAHVPDLRGFVKGIALVLKRDGVAVVEFPWVKELVDLCEFDTIYHEHFCYFSLTAVDRLFREFGLYINDVKRLPIHGGSLRIFAERSERVSERVKEMLALEEERGVTRYQYYEGFSRRVEAIREKLQTILLDYKTRGKRIAAYGAAAKGCILLNYINVDYQLIEYCVDRNVHKHGRTLPGLRIPVCAPDRLARDMPDAVVLLSWNFKDEVLEQQAAYLENGGHFVVPIPEPTVI